MITWQWSCSWGTSNIRQFSRFTWRGLTYTLIFWTWYFGVFSFVVHQYDCSITKLLLNLHHLTSRTCWHSKMSGDGILPTAETSARDVLPMCQDKFGHVGWTHSWSHCVIPQYTAVLYFLAMAMQNSFGFPIP